MKKIIQRLEKFLGDEDIMILKCFHFFYGMLSSHLLIMRNLIFGLLSPSRLEGKARILVE